MLNDIVNKFSPASIDDFIDFIIDEERSFTVFTPNIDHLIRCCKDRYIYDLYLNSDILINDSRVFSLLFKIFYGRSIRYLTGSDLTRELLVNQIIKSKFIGILGSDCHQVSILERRYSLLKPIIHYNPSYGFISNSEEIEYIARFVALNPKVCIWFIAVGSPQQEILASYLVSLGIRTKFLCVGASIDYLTGKEKRAPKFIQAMYLEWLYRFAQSPVKRFRRYFINCPQIIYYLLRERFLSK